LSERTWDDVFKKPGRSSAIPADPSVTVPYDPNNEFDEEAIKYWISFADFYVWPHIETFDSWDELTGDTWGICVHAGGLGRRVAHRRGRVGSCSRREASDPGPGGHLEEGAGEQ
jgi:hypothetical protein